jgi:predicted porin
MKKTLIALAVLGAAGSANAAEIYAMDGMTLDFSGEAEVQFIQSQTQDSDPAINVETATLTVDANYEIAEEMAAGGHYEIDGSGTTANISDLYVYFELSPELTMSVGRQSTVLDDAGIGGDYAFGFSSYIDTTKLVTSGDQVVKYTYDGGEVFYGALSYVMNKASTSGDYQADGSIGARVGDFDYTLFLAQSETATLNADLYTLEARYTLGSITLAGTYGVSSSEQTAAADLDQTIVGLAASFDDGGRWTYAAGWANVDDDSTDVNDVYVNASYWITDNVNAYAEVGFSDDDTQDTGYVVGMDVSF